MQTTIPTATTPPPLTIPNKTPVPISKTIPIKLANNVSTTSKPNSPKVITTTTTSKNDIASPSSNPTQSNPSSKTQYRPIEPMPSTSGIPKEKLIQTTKSPQTFLVLQKPKDIQSLHPRAQVLNFTITHTFDKNGQLNKEEDPVQRKAVILNKPSDNTPDNVVIKEEPKENNTLQYLMIKDEPIEWTEEIDILNPKEVSKKL